MERAQRLWNRVIERVRMNTSGEVSKESFLKSLTPKEQSFLSETLNDFSHYNDVYGTQLWVIAVGSAVNNIYNERPHNDIDLAIYSESPTFTMWSYFESLYRQRKILNSIKARSYGSTGMMINNHQSETPIHLIFHYDRHALEAEMIHRDFGTMRDKPWTPLIRLLDIK